MATNGCCRATVSPLKRSTTCFIYQAFRPTHTRSFRPSSKGTSSTVIEGTPHWKVKRSNSLICLGYRWDKEEIAADSEGVSFEVGVFLFNGREYYRCHDVFERLWNHAEEPQRTLLHGILQCCVGFYHLFNQNHHGAMAELGEGLSKLQKLKFRSGPFHQFEQDISAVLEFIYHTQMEHAACTDDYCLTMDGSAQSYQLLGNFGAGQPLYGIQRNAKEECYVYFSPKELSNSEDHVRVKVPVLLANEEDLKDGAKY
ncbi:hypothetical protein KI387_038864 [Taxus chinensis]|uniref:DUF309 domain-containing protein n=1 Tax=Taxus chinensis TaxID=29808 RepID=A0AA38CA03_TAXCH|nr:hypothetical protein KI387_038864 [Taxus chinensis]